MPDGYGASCGFLVVPQDRENPDGMQTRIHVAIFSSLSTSPAPDPVGVPSRGVPVATPWKRSSFRSTIASLRS